MTVLDAKGRVKTSLYDAAGRMDSEQYSDGHIDTLVYDAAEWLANVHDRFGLMTNALRRPGADDAAGTAWEPRW